MPQVPMQEPLFSRKGERFDTGCDPRDCNATPMPDVCVLSCSFGNRRGFAAR